MTSPGLLPIHPTARAAWPWLPAITRAGRIMIGPLGETLITTDTGGADVVITAGQPWHRSIAADPFPSRSKP